MNIMERINKSSLRGDRPGFRPGDTLKVHCRIKEGDKERIQIFEGVCIKRRRRAGISSSFTVRKISFGVGVERVFPSLAAGRKDRGDHLGAFVVPNFII